MTNQPYKKIYENGILINPITKDKPFLVESRADKRKMRKSNNSNSFGLVVAKIGSISFIKYKTVKHYDKSGRLRVNSILI